MAEISDNVGKKIVEALKMQNDSGSSIEKEEPVQQNSQIEEPVFNDTKEETESSTSPIEKSFTSSAPVAEGTDYFNKSAMSDIETAFQNSLNNNIAIDNFSAAQTDVEYPNNVVILNHLISKLPAGVTKQTGAIIIRQTMEALGIPMKSVIQEARQVQETLSNKARECQKNILEYKKQISTLETKSRQYQRQAVVMNDTINLFLNSGV